MNRNVEIKVRVESLEVIASRARELADEGPVVLVQEDTFFQCPRGRLKLRQFTSGAEAELIYYERSDESEPKESRYAIHRTVDPSGLRALLSAALGVRAVVRKRRILYLIGATRVHLDQVEELGEFVELEVVLEPDQHVTEATATARTLMDKLGISERGLVGEAYIDLLEAGSR
ncbi:MAG: class IV adenylate cyclase [Phycisphaerales bacterium]|nr:MAG: class IV adenylate cyclase [Phycisphaerales bacterium]